MAETSTIFGFMKYVSATDILSDFKKTVDSHFVNSLEQGMIDHSLFVLIPNSEGRNLGQTLSEVAMTEEANRVPIIQASFNVFPYVNPVATPAKNASPAPVVSFTSTFIAGQIPLCPSKEA